MAIQAKGTMEDNSDLDEVDVFNANRSKVLLDQAGEYVQGSESEDEDSQEEVMRSDSDEEDEEDEEEENEEEEDADEFDEEKGWGGKQNYYGGDDASDDEDSKQMTEEALRQQRKHLQDLEMDDYVDEEILEDWQKKAVTFDTKDNNGSQVVIDTSTNFESLDDAERSKLLKQSFPEFIPLMRELEELQPKLDELRHLDQNVCTRIKVGALSGYLASITSYMAIFVDNLRSGEGFTSMKDHPVMESILSSREVWRQANELPLEIKEETEEITKEVSSSDIDEEDFVDAKEEQDDSQSIEDVEEEKEEEEMEKTPKKSHNIDIHKKRVIRRVPQSTGDDFTEANIDDLDMEDKTRRKKTLRFYTAKIDKAASQREKYTSGDMDVPYKERLYERQQKLIEEARKRGLESKDIADDENYHAWDEDDNEYYDSLKQNKELKSANRKLAHAAAVKAAKEGKLTELQEEIGQDGKRAINYQILKNKGLTPHRKKEYRNSRVKKRKQYEVAKKKLKSVRQVYDSEKTRGPYEGEKTGIKKGLSRSVKLV
ncbi:Sas10 U3-containing small subunit processome complex subunit [Candida orthopsilosis Co 90-125]|uniref:Sas10 U3-containing small subunit processome complex subunit n=1 Tax=Candida orthopsilosis (strain 90-125) TaxID=1136231 RepID=H8X6L9_CANO9|nr:Sas10 U3-containing small subunit processome complex subunit [Candida orthopsilosis Co 90-125]CCG23630.1 Sas10 U3-containing small subunit processome complex subunit [Candida orthopsilosis Co 90-125]